MAMCTLSNLFLAFLVQGIAGQAYYGLGRYGSAFDNDNIAFEYVDDVPVNNGKEMDVGRNPGRESDKESSDPQDTGTTLVLTHVVFRHGDRTPDVSTVYPNDPYINETYFPFGKGQLIPAGRERSYAVGKALRKRYNNFIGPIYYPDFLEARSSSNPRTQMSLQLVLSGLFPPTKEFQVGSLNWQPIPYQFQPSEQDNLIATYGSCEKYFDIAEALESTPPYRKQLRPLERLYSYLSEHSGWNVNNTRLLFFIHNTLQTESEWGFPLPPWAYKVWREPLESAAVKFWQVLSSTPKLRQIAIGNLLKKIITDSQNKIEGTLTPNDRKIFLYAGHDFNIFPLLTALGHMENKLTPYSAYILIELHKINGKYGFKVYYQDYAKRDPKLIQLPNCDTFCPFEQFVDILQENIAGDDWC